MSTKLLSLWLPTMVGALLTYGNVDAQQPIFRTVVIASGCTVSSAGTVTFQSTIGQPMIGRSKSSPNVTHLGFWYPATPGSTSAVNDAFGQIHSGASLAIVAMPNPFMESTEIRFNNATSGRVTVRIYDQLGRLAGTLADDMMQSGPVVIHLDASEFASGNYMIEVLTGGIRTATLVTVVK